MLLIKKQDSIKEKVSEFVKSLPVNGRRPIFVFDIHKKVGSPNEDIIEWVESLKGENIFFLSYDGQEKRITEN